jgi:hypothetical protein
VTHEPLRALTELPRVPPLLRLAQHDRDHFVAGVHRRSSFVARFLELLGEGKSRATRVGGYGTNGLRAFVTLVTVT